MANTYSSLFYHFVFSTKSRKYFIKPEMESRLWRYIGGIANTNGFTAVQVGGIEDHVHVLALAPPKIEPSRMVKLIKGGSSRWIHSEFEWLRGFEWQDGYSAFSVSKSAVPSVDKYIRGQRSHHRRMSFEDEYKRLLSLHDIDPVDERYIFG
ncbi:MAG: IS200/IS605 family transposase [Aridibacter famidurans]|nr:IS200/IS605 family transposase [Aridibacter famidurans]